MNPLSVPVLLIASICFYVGLYHFILFLRQKDDKSSLAFAMLSITFCIYDIFSFYLYNANSLSDGIIWQRLQLSVTNLIGIFIIWFIFFLVKKTRKSIYISFSIFYLIFFLLELFMYNDLTLTLNNPAIKVISIGSYNITYYEASPGIIIFIGMTAQLLNFIYMLYLLIKNYRLSHNKYLKPIIIALLIFFITTINDYLVVSNVYKFIYVVEYSYFILIISMGNLLFNKFMDYKESFLKQFYIDNLTGQPNRNKLLIDIEETKKPLLALINIDSFKEINDIYGNEAGDYILIEVFNRLKKISLKFDYKIYRMHGDEYAILIEKHEKQVDFNKIDINHIVQYLFEEINDNTFKYRNNQINVRVTIGVADYDSIQNMNSLEILKSKVLNNADMVLKEAKKVKKSFMVYNESMNIDKEYEKNILWADKLKKALNNDRIKPYYQPIINNKTGKIEKYECLVRMIDADGSVIGPVNFIDISQKVRLYSNITCTVLKKSFDTFEKNNFEFSINLSAKDILNQETNHFIRFMLSTNSNIAKRIVFEILESESVSNYDVMNSFIQDVKLMGCKLAIDDFGAGFSNFDYIIKLKIDYIKIDASIIKNLDKDNNSYIIAKMIVNAAKELGVLTIAEFVHSKEVFNKCIELGIDYSQGYYFSEPKEYIDLE